MMEIAHASLMTEPALRKTLVQLSGIARDACENPVEFARFMNSLIRLVSENSEKPAEDIAFLSGVTFTLLENRRSF